jgi:hypothetical protein
LSRPPGATERKLWLEALASAGKKGRRAVFEDAAWALLNSSEFLFNH